MAATVENPPTSQYLRGALKEVHIAKKAKNGGARSKSPRRKPVPNPTGNMRSVFHPIEVGEVAKVALGLAPKKAPGPDGYAADVFKELPSLNLAIAQPFASILSAENCPQRLLDINITPSDKPGKIASDYTAKRPISLICSTSKILESAVLNRLIPAL